MNVTAGKVGDVLRTIEDPEIHMDLVELGLIYGIRVEEDALGQAAVTVSMTLTSPGCPYGAALVSKTHQEVSRLKGVGKVDVNLVWVPQWDPRRMTTPEVRMKMGILDIDDV